MITQFDEDEMAHQETKIADNAKESSLLDILMILENAYHHAAIKLGTIFFLVWSLNVGFHHQL
jgi:hypothetical protein